MFFFRSTGSNGLDTSANFQRKDFAIILSKGVQKIAHPWYRTVELFDRIILLELPVFIGLFNFIGLSFVAANRSSDMFEY